MYENDTNTEINQSSTITSFICWILIQFYFQQGETIIDLRKTALTYMWDIKNHNIVSIET